MNTYHAQDFGGDPFPAGKRVIRWLQAEGGPKKEGIDADEGSDADESKAYDLGGGD